MKKTLNLMLFCAICFSIMAFTPNHLDSSFTFDEMVKIYENEVIAFSIESSSTSAIVKSTFDQHNDHFQITTHKKIAFIQVLDDQNRLQFQMPMTTNEVHLNMKDFEIGEHKLSFSFESSDGLIASTLFKKP